MPLRAEILPLQARIRRPLICSEIQGTAKYSVEATDPSRDLNLPQVSATGTSFLVENFSRLSIDHNPRVDQVLPDLAPFAEALEENLTDLSFDQLQELVRALTLWPEAIRTSTISKQVLQRVVGFTLENSIGSITSWQVPNKLEESLRRIFDLLKLESNRRLSLKWVGEERFVSREKISFKTDHHALKVHISLQ